MVTVLLAARLVVAVSLGLAGLMKLGDRASSVDGAAALGVPDRFAKVVGTFLAPTELAVAALLLVEPTARAGAIASIAVFVAFTALVAVNLARDNRPTCHCFGELSQRPIGPGALARNALLLALSAVAATSPARGGSVVTVVGVGVIGGAFWWQRGRADAGAAAGEPVHGLAVGVVAPAFSLPGTDGAPITLATLLARAVPVLLVFSDARCRPCHHLMPEVAGWAGPELEVAVIMRGTADPSDAADWEITHLLADDGAVAGDYNALATPGALVVGADGRVASPIANGALAIRSLVGSIVRPTANTPAPTVAARPRPLVPGAAPPWLRLPTVAGHAVELAAFAGRLTVVVFVERLATIDALALDDRPTDGANILVVAIGDGAAARAIATELVVAVDADGMTARAFGVGTTPAGVLIDADGRVSATAEGLMDVRAMLARADVLVGLASRAPRIGGSDS